MDVQSYLDRINYSGDTTPTIENLNRIHEAHLLTVPFENLDIHLGRPIKLDKARIFRKIVGDRRGGFCYEMNGLFSWLLEQLGYDVTLLSSRSVGADGTLGIEHDHLMLQVKCPADSAEQANIPWLTDIGWGDNFHTPKRLDQMGVEQDDGLRLYKIEEAEDGFFIMSQRNYEEVWEKQYRFSLRPHHYSEYAKACHHHQTSPDSHFPKKRVCTMATPNGRITLSDDKIIITASGVKHAETITADQFDPLLKKHFGIIL